MTGKGRFTGRRMVRTPKEVARSGRATAFCRARGIPEATCNYRNAERSGIEASDVRRTKDLEEEDAGLKGMDAGWNTSR